MDFFARNLAGFRTMHKERVLLVEQAENGFWAVSATFDARTKTARLEDRWHVATLDGIAKPPFGGKYGRMVLALDEKRATTVESAVHIAREHPAEAIGEAELDAALFKALWNFLNKYRPVAAKKFGAGELELSIANISVCGARLGEHQVFNPLDFSGKDIYLRFRGTFVPKSMLGQLERLSAFVRENIVVVERGAILSEALGGENALVCVGAASTAVYASRGDESVFLGSCPWGVERMIGRLGAFFGAGPDAVRDALRRYAANMVSQRVRRAIERIVREEIGDFRTKTDAIAKAGGVERRALMRYSVAADESYSGALFDEEEFRPAVFFSAPPGGFAFAEGRVEMSSSAESAVRALLAFPYLHPQYAYLNQLLRRRVRWLVPAEQPKT